MQGKSVLALLRLVPIGLLPLGCLSCAAGTPPETPKGPIAPVRAQAPFPAGDRQPLENCPLPFDLSIPELDRWQRTDRRGLVVLEHSATSTKIQLRYWVTSRLVTLAQCEDELLTLDPEATARKAALEPVEPVATLDFHPGGDYHGSLSSKVTTQDDGAVSGWVHGTATGLGHCLVFDAKTKAAGPNAEKEIGGRLSVLMDGIAGAIRWREINRRVEPTKR